MERDENITNVKRHIVYTTPEELDILRELAESDARFFTHDKFFHAIWSIISLAQCFFKHFLPPNILKNVKLETLRRFPTKMVDKDGRETEGDLFFMVDTVDGAGMILVILLEHKSGSARYTSLQTLGYEVDVMKKLALDSKIYKNADGKLPMPFTVVLAQYDVPQVEDLFYWVKGTNDCGTHFRFHLVNLQKENFDAIMEEEPMLYLAMATSAFAYRLRDKEWDDEKDAELFEIFSHVFELDPANSENFYFFFEALLKYTAWFTNRTCFDMISFMEKAVETAGIKLRYDGKPIQTFLTRMLGDKVPEYYKNLEDRYGDCCVQIVRKDKTIDQQKEQIAELKEAASELKETASLQQAIILNFDKRFNAPIPSSMLQRLFAITKTSVLSRIYEAFQQRSSLEEFEADFNRLAVNSVL